MNIVTIAFLIVIITVVWYFYTKFNQNKLKKITATIGNKSSVFKLSENLDIDQYKLPRITKNRINNFIDWTRKIDRDKSRESISKLITNKLEIKVPEIGVTLIETQKTIGTIDSKDFDFKLDVFQIQKEECYSNILNIENDYLVTLLDKPKYLPVFDDEYDFQLFWDDTEIAEEYDIERIECEGNFVDKAYYYMTIDSSEYVSKSSNADDEFEFGIEAFTTAGEVGVDSECIRLEIKEASYIPDIEINGKQFIFNDNEKEYLILLLMASYKPDVLKKIKLELEK
jgi:hypothetical protein